MHIAILNGPNLGRLGKREANVYGTQTLDDLATSLESVATEICVSLVFFQSNHEGELIDCIEELSDKKVDGVVFNPGAFTHTSVALRDAIAGSGLKFVEVHISNVYTREEFRHKSLTAPVSVGLIAGLGFKGYEYALRHLATTAR